MATFPRRTFLKGAAVAGAGALPAPSILATTAPSERLGMAVIGLSRGRGHIRACLKIPTVDLLHVCDVDRERLEVGHAEVKKGQDRTCEATEDLRRILDDRSVDAISIATCNHWHAPATILACKAGKHVYVEKPGSHNAREGELMVAAARKHKRVVQMGNQRRSWPGIMKGIQRLHEGAIGTVRYARCWYTNQRGSIGKGKHVPVPDRLNFDLWQGPAPERPYVDNLVHYNWHWRWHWGNGELGNNGVHSLDLARWGLEVDAPRRVTYNGGRYHYPDDQETPDSGTAVYDFGDRGASWEQSSCHPRKPESYDICTFYGDGGRLTLRGGGYVIHDLKGEETEKDSAPGGDVVHFEDFFNAIRSGKRPHSEIEDAQRSTLLCHLGNLAYQTGQTIHFDPDKGEIIGSPQARKRWGREYRDGWKPEV